MPSESDIVESQLEAGLSTLSYKVVRIIVYLDYLSYLSI